MYKHSFFVVVSCIRHYKPIFHVKRYLSVEIREGELCCIYAVYVDVTTYKQAKRACYEFEDTKSAVIEYNDPALLARDLSILIQSRRS